MKNGGFTIKTRKLTTESWIWNMLKQKEKETAAGMPWYDPQPLGGNQWWLPAGLCSSPTITNIITLQPWSAMTNDHQQASSIIIP